MNRRPGEAPILELDGAWSRYATDAPWALEDVHLAFSPRTHSGILGPNGAGKSTLLRLLAGLRLPDRGEVRIDGRPTAEWERRALSRRLALASPVEEQGFPMRVRDYVALGRSPYLGRFGAPSEGDDAAVERALDHTDLGALAERRLDQLSAGELQRARIARALSQEPAILLLDEPTAHLDVGHEMSAFEIIEEIQRQQHVTVVSITHNINMASRFCDRIVLLGGGRLAGDGTPGDVLTAARLSDAFDHAVAVEVLEGMGRVAVPVRESRP